MTNTESTSATSGDQKIPMMTEEILVAARKLIEKPENWKKKALHSPDDCAHCAVGAIEFVLGKRSGLGHWPSLEQTKPFVAHFGFPQWKGLSDWNDSDERTHAEVLAAFDAAIAACGSPVVTPPNNEEAMVP